MYAVAAVLWGIPDPLQRRVRGGFRRNAGAERPGVVSGPVRHVRTAWPELVAVVDRRPGGHDRGRLLPRRPRPDRLWRRAGRPSVRLRVRPRWFRVRGGRLLEERADQGLRPEHDSPPRRCLAVARLPRAARRSSTAASTCSRPKSSANELQEARGALRDRRGRDEWKPLLDKYDIRVVMIEESSSPATYLLLMQSPNWVPFYDDGNVIMFGRADASPADLAIFQANRLDAEALAYRHTRPTPAVERPPTQMTWMDEIFQGRSLTLPQPHTEAAKRWLRGRTPTRASPRVPTRPAACSPSARRAPPWPRSPTTRRPSASWPRPTGGLMVQESARCSPGSKLTPENAEVIGQVAPQPRPAHEPVPAARHRAELRDPDHPAAQEPADERQELRSAEPRAVPAVRRANFIDLARDRLQAVLDKAGVDDASRPTNREPRSPGLADSSTTGSSRSRTR